MAVSRAPSQAETSLSPARCWPKPPFTACRFHTRSELAGYKRPVPGHWHKRSSQIASDEKEQWLGLGPVSLHIRSRLEAAQ